MRFSAIARHRTITYSSRSSRSAACISSGLASAASSACCCRRDRLVFVRSFVRSFARSCIASVGTYSLDALGSLEVLALHALGLGDIELVHLLHDLLQASLDGLEALLGFVGV